MSREDSKKPGQEKDISENRTVEQITRTASTKEQAGKGEDMRGLSGSRKLPDQSSTEGIEVTKRAGVEARHSQKAK